MQLWTEINVVTLPTLIKMMPQQMRAVTKAKRVDIVYDISFGWAVYNIIIFLILCTFILSFFLSFYYFLFLVVVQQLLTLV